jgi:hypothetical protein
MNESAAGTRARGEADKLRTAYRKARAASKGADGLRVEARHLASMPGFCLSVDAE